MIGLLIQPLISFITTLIVVSPTIVAIGKEDEDWNVNPPLNEYALAAGVNAVSYTHLTLPTN